MTPRDHILALILAQNSIRMAWADFDGTTLGNYLRDIDKQMTKAINELGTNFPVKKEAK